MNYSIYQMQTLKNLYKIVTGYLPVLSYVASTLQKVLAIKGGYLYPLRVNINYLINKTKFLIFK